jgi:hypothetical protein
MVLLPLIVGIVLGVGRAQTATDTEKELSALPVNPNATPEARDLLREIDQISEHSTLTGQHNFPTTSRAGRIASTI